MKIKSLLTTGLLALAASTQAATLYVDGANGDDEKNCKSAANACKTPWKAYDESATGDEIWITKGDYVIPAGCHYSINKAVTFKGGFDSSFEPLLARSNDASKTVLTGNNAMECRLFLVETGHGNWLTFDTLTLTGAASSQNDHGAIYLYNTGGWLRLHNVIMRDTHMRTGEGAIKSDVAGNKLEIIDSHFENNIAKTDGGAIAIRADADVLIKNSSFIGNKSTLYGGAIYTSAPRINLEIEDSVFKDNEGSRGGALSVEPGSRGDRDSHIYISRSSFTHNKSRNHGGAIYTEVGKWHISNTTISNNIVENSNHNGSGGGIGNNGAFMKLDYVTLVGNHSENYGGGLGVWDDSNAEVEIMASVITGNTSYKSTAALSSDDIWLYNNSTIIDKGYNLIGSHNYANMNDKDGSLIDYRYWFNHQVDDEFTTQLVTGDPANFVELAAKQNGGLNGVYTNKLKNGKNSGNPAIDAVPNDGVPFYGVGTAADNPFVSLRQAAATVGMNDSHYKAGNIFYFDLKGRYKEDYSFEAGSEASLKFTANVDADGWVQKSGLASQYWDEDITDSESRVWVRQAGGVCSGLIPTDARGMPRADKVKSTEPPSHCDIGAFEYNDYYQLDCEDEDGMRPENNPKSVSVNWCFNPFDKDLTPQDVMENIGLGAFNWYWSFALLGLLAVRIRK